MTSKENLIADALKWIGWAWLAIGLLLGMIHFTAELPGDPAKNHQGLIAFAYAAGGVMWCAIFLGFSEVVGLLQGIYNQGERKRMPSSALKQKVKEKTPYEIVNEPPYDYEKEIKNYYFTHNRFVDSIERTVIEDIFKVKIKGEVEYIELGGFKPVVLSEEAYNKLLE
ncbi:hypothetical protein [Fictibacillus barbaricus]|uniref:Uncharacterized protein n=1 Tax=Fictibacillus barbaricus TaxID=182136 RepID=A0ABU1U4K1_9BACL|nr:hypothetical protein [Fictibacillus barbaricus]MDR7074407.1 hypothetical protein [Fictibacillus barbaricus]